MQNDEKKTYYDIIVKCWIAFSKERSYPEFSEDWWKSVISDFDSIHDEYAKTDQGEVMDAIGMALLNEHERRQKNVLHH